VGDLLGGAERLAAQEALHDRLDPLGRQPPGRGQALGQDLAVAAVRAEDLVLRIERRALPHGRRLLADGEVGRAAVVVGDPAPGAGRLEGVEHALELADDDHVDP
jgi:hypothetical protein